MLLIQCYFILFRFIFSVLLWVDFWPKNLQNTRQKRLESLPLYCAIPLSIRIFSSRRTLHQRKCCKLVLIIGTLVEVKASIRYWVQYLMFTPEGYYWEIGISISHTISCILYLEKIYRMLPILNIWIHINLKWGIPRIWRGDVLCTWINTTNFGV